MVFVEKLWFSINNCMNYTASDITEFFQKHESKVTHNLVAHTKFRPYNHSKAQIDAMANESKKALRYALNCFGKSLYPNHSNYITRKPEINSVWIGDSIGLFLNLDGNTIQQKFD